MHAHYQNAASGEVPAAPAPVQKMAIDTLYGTTSWFATVVVAETILGLSLLSQLSSELRVGLGISYFLLLLSTWILAVFVRDTAREQRLDAAGYSLF
jgi:hypothetical protein